MPDVYSTFNQLDSATQERLAAVRDARCRSSAAGSASRLPFLTDIDLPRRRGYWRAEARRRVETGTFFGHIAYASLIAGKRA